MKVLIVYCHPSPKSFNAAILEEVKGVLAQNGASMRVLDLYGEGFDPVLSREGWEGYEDTQTNTHGLEAHTDALQWCDTLIFIYPTWWYGQPAILKGWLDRVMLPGIAFHMPDGGDIKPGLRHISGLGVFTTCGASWWLTRFIGSPGRRIIMRGLRLLCAPRTKTVFAAHYSMDGSTPSSREKHLRRVRAKMQRFVKDLKTRRSSNDPDPRSGAIEGAGSDSTG